MLLAIDIGNSTIGIGLFLDPSKKKNLLTKKICSHPVQAPEKYKKIFSEFVKTQISSAKNSAHKIDALDAIVSSVVPALDQPVIKALKNICGKNPLIVSHKLDCGISFDILKPETVGADRIANAVAGFDYFKKPVAVVDFGTATTITIVGKKQNLLGGAILPGIELMQKSLYSGTARLPFFSLKSNAAALGKNTESSINSGIIYGSAGAVEKIIKNMEKELHFRLKLALTGGHAGLITGLIERDHIVSPHLTFEGLRLIHINNRTMVKQNKSVKYGK